MMHLVSSSWLTILLVSGCSSMLDLGTDDRDASGADAGPRAYRTDPCGNGIDDDHNGRIDDGCPCGPGETQSCFSADVRQRRTGTCDDGVQTCTASGSAEWGDWGNSPCMGDTPPSEELCDGRDHDCDGTRDEGCHCTVGDTQVCGTELLGSPCTAGVQTCAPEGTWGECEGALGPTTDICDGVDNDCDGTVDVGCDCTPEPERCRDGIDNDCDGVVDEPACTPDWLSDGGLPPSDGGLDAGPPEGCPGRTIPDFRDRIEWVTAIPGAVYQRTHAGSGKRGAWLAGPSNDTATVELRGTSYTFAGTSSADGNHGRMSFLDGTQLSLAPRLTESDFWDMSVVDVTGNHFMVAGTFIGTLATGFATWTSSSTIYTSTPPGPAPDMFWARRSESGATLVAGEHYGVAGIPPDPMPGSFYPWLSVHFGQVDEDGNVYWGGTFSGSFSDDGHAIDSDPARPVPVSSTSFLVSTTGSGTTRWARSWYGETESQGVVDPSGRYLVRTGQTTGTTHTTLELLDAATGATLFRHESSASSGIITVARDVDVDGNVVIAGENGSAASVVLGGLTISPTHAFIASFDRTGSLRWSHELLDTSVSLRGNRSYRIRAGYGYVALMLGLSLGPSSTARASTTLHIGACAPTIDKRWYARSPDTGVPTNTPPPMPFDTSTYAEADELILLSFAETTGALRWMRRADAVAHLNNSLDLHPSGDLLLVMHGDLFITAPVSYGAGLLAHATHVMRISGD